MPWYQKPENQLPLSPRTGDETILVVEDDVLHTENCPVDTGNAWATTVPDRQ